MAESPWAPADMVPASRPVAGPQLAGWPGVAMDAGIGLQRVRCLVAAEDRPQEHAAIQFAAFARIASERRIAFQRCLQPGQAVFMNHHAGAAIGAGVEHHHARSAGVVAPAPPVRQRAGRAAGRFAMAREVGPVAGHGVGDFASAGQVGGGEGAEWIELAVKVAEHKGHIQHVRGAQQHAWRDERHGGLLVPIEAVGPDVAVARRHHRAGRLQRAGGLP